MASLWRTTSFALLLAVVYCAKLPSYIKPCHQNDPELSKCVGTAITIVQKHMRDGIPELQLPSMNPLKITRATIERGSDFKAIITDFDLYYLDKLILDDITVDLESNFVMLKLRFDKLYGTAKYEVDGHIMGLHLIGSGPCEGNYTNIKVEVTMKGTRYNKNGKEYFKFDNRSLDLDLGRPSFNFERLFGDNEELTKHTNQLINDNIVDLLKDMKKPLEDAAGQFVFELILRPFRRFSVMELFPK